MLKLASALVAVSLFLSPALAKTKAPAPAATPAPVVKCITPEQALKSVPEAQLLQRLDGDAVKKFVEGAQQKFNQPLPAGADTILIFKRDQETVLFALFVNGCYKGMGGMERKTLRELLDDDDNGSI